MTPSSDKHCYKVLLTLLIAPLLLGTKSMPATVKLCESQEPIQEELDEMLASTGTNRPELAILLQYGCTVRTELAGPATLEEHVSRSYWVAWPQYRKVGDLWFYDSMVCAYRDGADPNCRATGELAKWLNGNPFRFDSEIQPEELSELARVLKDVFSADVNIWLVGKHKWHGANWRTGERSYAVYIGTPPRFDSYVVTRDCMTIDRCSWDVSGTGRAHHMQ